MASLSVLDKEGKSVGSVELPDEVFGQKVKTGVIHQAVVMYQACQRQGHASTKERGAVSGGGKKPYRQKGTGRARAGSSRSPLWHGGGVVFGPHPREFRYSVPKKIRQAALRESLNAKFQSKTMICVQELTGKIEKTKDFAKILKNWGGSGKTVALLDGSDDSIFRASRNIPRFKMLASQDVNAYDVMRHKTLLLTQKAIETLLKRIELTS